MSITYPFIPFPQALNEKVFQDNLTKLQLKTLWGIVDETTKFEEARSSFTRELSCRYLAKKLNIRYDCVSRVNNQLAKRGYIAIRKSTSENEGSFITLLINNQKLCTPPPVHETCTPSIINHELCTPPIHNSCAVHNSCTPLCNGLNTEENLPVHNSWAVHNSCTNQELISKNKDQKSNAPSISKRENEKEEIEKIIGLSAVEEKGKEMPEKKQSEGKTILNACPPNVLRMSSGCSTAPSALAPVSQSRGNSPDKSNKEFSSIGSVLTGTLPSIQSNPSIIPGISINAMAEGKDILTKKGLAENDIKAVFNRISGIIKSNANIKSKDGYFLACCNKEPEKDLPPAKPLGDLEKEKIIEKIYEGYWNGKIKYVLSSSGEKYPIIEMDKQKFIYWKGRIPKGMVFREMKEKYPELLNMKYFVGD